MFEDAQASPENDATVKFFDQYIDEIDSSIELGESNIATLSATLFVGSLCQ